MLLHVVCFKYKPDVDAATRAEHLRRLGTLKDVDGIADLRVGGDVVHSARSYDAGLAITFTDRAALDTYQKHERHVPVAQFGAGLYDSIVAVDIDI